jgi:Fic family protein
MSGIPNTSNGHSKKSSRHGLLFLVKQHIIDEKERMVRRMRNFDYSTYQDKRWDVEIVNYLSAIHEARGKQTLFLRQKEETLNRLVEIAKVQSTEASNAIEGICTTQPRLKQLISEKTTPRNRDEKEILGYRDALNVVHESFEYIPITPNYILQLHKIMSQHTDSSFGGQFKNVQNYISATDAQGNRFILFTPLAPYETPAAMQALCDSYNMAIGEGIVDPLLLIPVFIHDFLCIHPFIDGNGRMSRLLTTLLLYRSGYYVGRYISLEAKIAKNKDFYYEALQQSQTGWHEGTDDPTPFIKYMLGTVISAYRDFEDRVELVDEKLPSIEMVRSAVRQKIGKFKKADVLELCPSLSAASVERSIKALCHSGELSKHGSGRSTYYLRETI